MAAAAATFANPGAASPALSAFRFAFDYDGPIRIGIQAASTECHTGVAGYTCYGGNDPNPDPGFIGPGNGTFNETTYAIGQIDSFSTPDGTLLWSAESEAAYDIAFFLYGESAPATTRSPHPARSHSSPVSCRRRDEEVFGVVVLAHAVRPGPEFLKVSRQGGWLAKVMPL